MMKIVNFKTISNDNPTYTMWHLAVQGQTVKTGIIQN